MNLSIFGTGYVGLVSGACLAEVGHHVVCMDVDPVKIEKLKTGILPIWEPGLEALVERNVMEGRLHFTTDAAHAVQHGQVQFIAVGTPSDEDGSADLQYVLAVAQSIASHMTDYRVIVNKSTVPVGTADKVAATIQAELDARFVTPDGLPRRCAPRNDGEGIVIASEARQSTPAYPTFSVVSNPDLADAPALLEKLQFMDKPMEAVQGAILAIPVKTAFTTPSPLFDLNQREFSQ